MYEENEKLVYIKKLSKKKIKQAYKTIQLPKVGKNKNDIKCQL